jgi:hypothetical protein
MCTCEADGDQMLRRWRKRTNEGRGDPHATDDGVGYVSTPSSPHIGGHGAPRADGVPRIAAEAARIYRRAKQRKMSHEGPQSDLDAGSNALGS